MTEYGQHITDKSTPQLSHDSIKEAKEQRKKLLAAVFQRRRENYRRWYKKMQLQAGDDLI